MLKVGRTQDAKCAVHVLEQHHHPLLRGLKPEHVRITVVVGDVGDDGIAADRDVWNGSDFDRPLTREGRARMRRDLFPRGERARARRQRCGYQQHAGLEIGGHLGAPRRGPEQSVFVRA